MNRTIRTMLGVAATAGILALGVPAFTGAANASTTSATASAGLRQGQSFLFNYTFNGHLKVAGGNFTVDHRVFLGPVKFNTGRWQFSDGRSPGRTPSLPAGPFMWRRRSRRRARRATTATPAPTTRPPGHGLRSCR